MSCDVCRSWNSGDWQLGDTYILARDGFVKIGLSQDVVSRIYALDRGDNTMQPPRLGDPLDLIALFVGKIEHELHQQFADAHLIGEWFVARPVLAAVPDLTATYPTRDPLPCTCRDCTAKHRATVERERTRARKDRMARWAAWAPPGEAGDFS